MACWGTKQSRFRSMLLEQMQSATFSAWSLTTSVLIFWVLFFTIPILQRTYPYVQHQGKVLKKQRSSIILRQNPKIHQKINKNLQWRTSYFASYCMVSFPGLQLPYSYYLLVLATFVCSSNKRSWSGTQVRKNKQTNKQKPWRTAKMLVQDEFGGWKL